jgi:GTP-binding protein
MFYDTAKVEITSGDGGDGMISFRREKFVPYGGPDGGDGGRGGDVFAITSIHRNSLIAFHNQKHFRAENGKHGTTKSKTGAAGKSIYLEVPLGTIIRNAETGDLLADMTEPGQEVLLLAGGRAGRGNIHFATSRNQAPRTAERGEPGETILIEMELKLIADVGIVGVPNAGKSTLLSVVSAAKPKIANYPFTTLQPNLGVVTLDDYETMVLADIPGLIEGAAEGVGLGHEFLRHVERTRVLIHLLDGASLDPLQDWRMINAELGMYSPKLAAKPQLVVLSKIDLPDAQAWESLVKEAVLAEDLPFTTISAVTGQGVREMLYQVKAMLDAAPPPEPLYGDEEVVIRPEEDAQSFTVYREGDGWRVSGQHIERVASMTYFEFDEPLMRFQQILERIGITAALEEAGVQVGDSVFIGDRELEWGE